ncbi:MAG: universal stress protein [Actinomycetes bacterium]
MAAGPVVVGVDGSEHAGLAVDWAVDAAVREHRRLVLLHAWHLPVAPVAVGVYDESELHEALDQAGRAILDQARDRARTRAGGHDLEITPRLVSGESAAQAMVDESIQAGLLVLGSRGLGGFAAVLLGSVAMHVAAHARCPVVVIRGVPAGIDGPVVVGVDGSTHTQQALAFGFEQAAARGVGLLAVHVWRSTSPDELDAASASVPGVPEAEMLSRRLLSEQLAGWAAQYPDVPVSTAVEHGAIVPSLVRTGHQGCLLVVGSRGLGGFSGLLLGSVSRGLLDHADSPVAIVRADRPVT